MNAYAERFVRSIKSACLDRMIFVGRASLYRRQSPSTRRTTMKSGAIRGSGTNSSAARRRSRRVPSTHANGWVACSSTTTGGRLEMGVD